MERFKRWFVSEEDLQGLNPIKARDIIIKCFFEAQKETFARVKESLGRKVTDEEILDSVTNALRLVFKEIGGSFDNPTKEDLFKIVERLASKSASWGTPQDIIEHHRSQIEKVLKALR